jgi:hypothetical protein
MRRTASLVTLALVTSSTVGARGADSESSSPDSSSALERAPGATPPSEPPWTWAVGVRGSAGTGSLERVPILCQDCSVDRRGYALYGGQAYVSWGRESSGWRLQTSIDLLYGPGKIDNFGTLLGARALMGGAYSSSGQGRNAFLFEFGGGISYYGLPPESDASIPCLAISAAIGARLENFELLGRLSLDSFFALETMYAATVSLGYAFQHATAP